MLHRARLRDWTLDRVFASRAEASPDAPFLHSALTGDTLTFAEAFDRARAMAARLSAWGVSPGERVAVMASNSLAALNCWFALNLAGATDVSINPANRGHVLEYLVNRSGASRLIIERSLLPVLLEIEDALPALKEVFHFCAEGDEESGALPASRRLSVRPLASLPDVPVSGWVAPQIDGADVASVLFTSGTSGPSKGVMVRHAHALLSARSCALGVRMSADDSLYCFHPFFHMAAKHCGILSALLAGARVVIDHRFDPEIWLDSIIRHGITIALGHGPMLEMIHQQPQRPGEADTTLTRLICAPVPKHIAADFERRFGVRAIEIWGMSELGLPCWRPFDAPLVPGSCGPVLSEWFELRVVDPATGDELPRGGVGELRVRPRDSTIVMAGYLDDEAATAACWNDGWFCTGDAGSMDEDGWVHVHDRMTDRIRRRGENISPADIEFAASGYPSVVEAVAVGVPSGFVSDEDIKMFVVGEAADAIDPEGLLRWLAERLPHYMVPRYIEVLQELPRTPTGKVRRSELRKRGAGPGIWDRKAAGIELRQLISEVREGP